MPIYEFYCDDCNVIFNFFSSRVNTEKVPACPRCNKDKLEKKISTFATIGKAKDESDEMLAGLDETKMEQAFESLMHEADGISEDDPKQMATLMRKFTSQTGIRLGDSMEEAISRMEAGEDPDLVEKEMGDQLNDEDFSFESVRKRFAGKRNKPDYDDTLYEL